jgi:DNA helicase IV
MQLRMIRRRTRGTGLTLLGDIAQGTGPVAYATWDEVARHLPGGDGAALEELRHAYRVPREIMAVALPLLDTIAPRTERPLAYRVGGSEPIVRRVAEEALLREAYGAAADLADDGLLAVIVPDELLEPALAHPNAFDGIALLTPRQAKGLEFDHVVVVEPALIAAQHQGLRQLYVALTRPTKTLVVVHARALPEALGSPDPHHYTGAE